MGLGFVDYVFSNDGRAGLSGGKDEGFLGIKFWESVGLEESMRLSSLEIERLFKGTEVWISQNSRGQLCKVFLALLLLFEFINT